MLTIISDKNQMTGANRLLAVATEHQFADAETANTSDHTGFGMAPPSSQSRRATRLRRRARNHNSGWRVGIGA